MEEERKGLGAESAEAASSAGVTPAPATGAAVTAGNDGEGDASGPDQDGAAGGTATGAPRKRRRGRRGGRRHKKKPNGNGANGDGDDVGDAGEEGERAPAAGAARSPQARRPQGQQRGGRPPAGSRPKPGESRSGGDEASPSQPSDSSSARSRTSGRAPAGGEAVAAGPVGSAVSAGPAGSAATAGPAAEGGLRGDADAGESSGEGEGPVGGAAGAPRKRRRRGGRGRGGSGRTTGPREGADASPGGNGGNGAATADGASIAEGKTADAPASGGGSRQGQRSGGANRAGGTRLAAQKARREQRPRRPRKRLSEGEARALRGEAKTMLIHDHEDRTQIAVLESGALIEHFVAHQKSRTIVGNVYLGKVQNVLPSMEAAFVDVGRGRNAVLYAGEVNYEAEDLEGDGPMPRIEQMLKPGQAVMVQVTKDALGTKGARLTAQISLAGRYLVLAPEQNVSGISRRLAEDERSRLRQIFRDIKPKQHGVIVRTAAEGASREALERDLNNLLKVWEEVQAEKKKAKAPALLHAEPELVMRVVRDIFSGDFERVVVDSRGMYETIKGYLEEQGPDLIERIDLHEGPLPMLEQYHVTEQIHKALERKVWLPSGGSIVIDRTEAMTVIDVNTGKFVGKGGSLEDTVLKNNIEAAEEVARQLRLRDIGGIIVIDFIDMLLPSNREQVLRTLKRALGRDKTRSQVFDVSNLGLVEMTRKRVSEGLLDAFSEPCPNCDGRGIVITHDID